MTGTAHDLGQIGQVQRASLNTQVASIIRDLILTGRLRPGERLVQAEWAARLGVSRMPVRDAITQLGSEGIVDLAPGGTAVVRPINAEDIRDGYELYARLSSFAAERAAVRRSDDDLRALASIQEQLEAAVSAGDLERASQLNWEFHSTINAAAQSARLLAMLSLLSPSFPHATFQVIPDWPERAIEHHRDILDGLRRGDADAVAALVQDHLDAASRAMLAKLYDGAGPDEGTS